MLDIYFMNNYHITVVNAKKLNETQFFLKNGCYITLVL